MIQIKAIRYFTKIIKEGKFPSIEKPPLIKTLVIDNNAIANAFNDIDQNNIMDKIKCRWQNKIH